MEYNYKTDCLGVDWIRVKELLSMVGMSYVTPDRHRSSFEKSYAVVFIYDQEQIIGMGRSISDGIRQSALYDIAIDPNYQGQGLGKKIVTLLMKATPDCNFILYASPGKENFYRSMGFKKMKTGMILFNDPSKMIDSPFIDE